MFIRCSPDYRCRIDSKFNDVAGFYSNLFFAMNHYIYAKQNGYSFTLDSKDWILSSEDGWNDYFEPMTLSPVKGCHKKNKVAGHNQILENYKLADYQTAIREIYKFNPQTQGVVNMMKRRFNLKPGEYDAILVRRGDKLISESKFIRTEDYLNLLFERNPKCRTIFVQTDDYNAFLDTRKYVEDKKLTVDVFTLCEPDRFGTIVSSYEKERMLKALENSANRNKDYLSKIADKLRHTKPVSEMNAAERYEHTIEMLAGIDIVLNSQNCILDYQSNVTRFIKLAHNKPSHVYDIMIHDAKLDMTIVANPAYSFKPVVMNKSLF